MLARLAWPLGMLFLSSCATVDHAVTAAPAVPAKPAAASHPIAGIEHTVRKGETLWRISRMYQTDLEEILRANSIPDSTVISVGQKIVIPTETSKAVSLEDPQTSADTDFIWPLEGPVLVSFKQKKDGVLNKGVDIQTRSDQKVCASGDGVVDFVGTLPGYGTTIIVDHAGNISTVYAGPTTALVTKGQQVPQGTVLAKITPSSGKQKEALHFEVRNRHRPQNPLYYLK